MTLSKNAKMLTASWRESNGNVVYGHRMKKGGGQVLFYFNPARANGPIPTTDTLWEYVEGLNPFTADVVLAVLAQLAGHRHPSLPGAPDY